MTLVQLYDAAYPPESDPSGIDGCEVYIGGNADHTWTDAELAEQHSRYRLPVWCYARGRNARDDADAVNRWLDQHRVPTHRAVMLDMETSVDADYVKAFDVELDGPLWLYGSIDTLFANPEADGWFVANPTGYAHLYAHPGVVGTQYAWAQLNQTRGPYDLDLIAADSVQLLWDTQSTGDVRDYVTTGTETLGQLAERTGVGASTILRLTAENGPDRKFSHDLAAYLDAEPWSVIPAGITLKVHA